MVTCPACNADLEHDEDELDEGDEFTCDECGATLRVMSLNPIELQFLEDSKDEEEEEEDSEEEDEEYEEEEEEENEERDW